MKKIMSIMAALALISVSVFAGSVEMKTSGPSGQGNLIWWAPSTGITNLEMTPTGLKSITMQAGAMTATATVTKQTTTPVFAATNDPTVTVTKQTTTPVFAATNAPTITVTKETVTPVFAATNDPVVTVTPQTVVVTNIYAATISYGTFTNVTYEGAGATNVFTCPTGIVWSTSTTTVMTNATATATLTAGESVAIMTNATAASSALTAGASVAIVTNVAATATLTVGESVAIMTNATVAITVP